MPSKKIQNSNVFTNDPEFEVEIEYVGNKMRYKGEPEEVLNNFISDQGKILPRRITGLSSKEQKKVTKLIKTARIAALLPFIIGKG